MIVLIHILNGKSFQFWDNWKHNCCKVLWKLKVYKLSVCYCIAIYRYKMNCVNEGFWMQIMNLNMIKLNETYHTNGKKNHLKKNHCVQ